MKKKFSKKRFYKRRAYQLMANVEDAFQKSQAMISDAKELNDAITRMRQKQYDEQQAEFANGTARIITAEHTKIPPITTGGKILGHDGVIRIVV